LSARDFHAFGIGFAFFEGKTATQALIALERVKALHGLESNSTAHQSRSGAVLFMTALRRILK